MIACIDFFEMSEICRPKFIVRHTTNTKLYRVEQKYQILAVTLIRQFMKKCLI
jgi:hypothetical protein